MFMFVPSAFWKTRDGWKGEQGYKGFMGAKSLAVSAIRSAVAFPTDMGSSFCVCELIWPRAIGSFLMLSICLKRLSISHSGSPMMLMSSPFRRASMRSIDDLESVQIVICQEDGNIIDTRVMASSSVL